MDGKSTQVQRDEKMLRKECSGKGVSSKTLNYLRMFARTYNAESSLPVVSDATCMN